MTQYLAPAAPARLWLAEALVEVPATGCHWPLGETDSQREFHFCGAACPTPGLDAGQRPQYCPVHLRMAYLRRGETQEQRNSENAPCKD